MNFSDWLGTPPEPLARVLGDRLAVFREQYARHASWPVTALPAAMSETYALPARRADALAAGCALFFLAADIIDDAQDGDLPEGLDWREAVNAGQAFLFASLGAFAEAAPGAPVAREVHHAGGLLAGGQALDLGLTWRSGPTEDTVMAAVSGKSGASLALFARMGAHAAGLPPAQVALWSTIGESMGVAIQLWSDSLDMSRDGSRDFREQKATLPAAYALRRDGGAFLAAAEGGDRSAAYQAMRACGALTFVEFKIDALRLQASEAMDELGLQAGDRERLEGLLHFGADQPLAL